VRSACRVSVCRHSKVPYREVSVPCVSVSTLLEHLLQQQGVLGHALYWLEKVAVEIKSISELHLLLLISHKNTTPVTYDSYDTVGFNVPLDTL